MQKALFPLFEADPVVEAGVYPQLQCFLWLAANHRHKLYNNRIIAGDECRASATALYADYKQWATDGGERSPLTSTAFGTKLADRGFAKFHSERGAVYLGIGLRSHDEQPRG